MSLEDLKVKYCCNKKKAAKKHGLKPTSRKALVNILDQIQRFQNSNNYASLNKKVISSPVSDSFHADTSSIFLNESSSMNNSEILQNCVMPSTCLYSKDVRIYSIMKSNVNIYSKILCYEPVSLEEIVDITGCSNKHVISFLDRKGICFTTDVN